MRDVSGLRYFRSFLTASGDEVVTSELDLQLSPRLGIAIASVLGVVNGIDFSAIGTVLETNSANQTLHAESGPVEVPLAPGVDEFVLDTDIFYIQTVILGGITTAAAGAGFGVLVTPTGLVTYDPPQIVSRNLTHRVESETALGDLEAMVLVRYKYVEFTLEELGILLARRS